MKRSEMHEMLTTIFLQWPHVTVTEPMTGLWHKAFSETQRDEFWEAIVATTKTQKNNFPPSIGQVNEMLESLKRGPEDQLTEGEVWKMIIDTVQRFGSYRQDEALAYLKNLSPRVGKTAEIMGWREICQWPLENETANRAHTWRVYGGLKDRDFKSDLLGKERQDPVANLQTAELLRIANK